jgi:hypothetical protein
MAKALKLEPSHKSEEAAMYVFLNEKWARRLSGVVGSDLVN